MVENSDAAEPGQRRPGRLQVLAALIAVALTIAALLIKGSLGVFLSLRLQFSSP